MGHSEAALRMLALRVERAHPTQIFTEAGSPANTALSQQAARNDEGTQSWAETLSALCCSPMFALAAAEFAADQRRDTDSGMMTSLARRRALLRFATRMFLAGRLSAR